MFQGKRFVSNEKVIAEVEAYFEAKDESLYKKGIETIKIKIKTIWNDYSLSI